jgi:LCP family protein required for cell wall assembly
MKRIIIKIFICLAVIFFISVLAYFSFFAWKIRKTGEKITITPQTQNSADMFQTLRSFISKKNLAALKGEEGGRINILLLGIAGQGKAGTNLTDTIIVASINTRTNQVGLISIPRDFYARIPGDAIQMKINSVYQYGLNKYGDIDPAVKTLESIITEMTSLPINYYAVMNFEGFEKAIDAIGGINVMNERDIFDSRYPGPNFSYETFELKKGFQRLDGATALKYARERHDDPEGDFGRAKRQQEVMQSAKNKIFSTATLFDFFALNKLLNTLGNNVKTDISAQELESFFELTKKLDTNNINNVVVDAWNKDSLLKVSHVFFGNIRAFVLVPRAGNMSEIQELSQNVFDLNKIKRRKDEITKENASVVIVNKSGDAGLAVKIKKLFNASFNYKNVVVLSDSQKMAEEKTTAYDLTNGARPFTLDEIVGKLPASASYNIPAIYNNLIKNISADIVVVLGKDIVSRYNMEEDSIEDYRQSSDTNNYMEVIDSYNK